MTVFSYRAMNPSGRMVNGQMDAVNLVDLEMRLRRMDLDFINGRAVQRRSWAFGGGVPRRELINFCFHLEQLVRAGVPILEGLTDLRDSIEQPRFREIIAAMIESIEGGRTLSQAMQEHPKIFNAVFCSLVRAGEDSGNLTEVLTNLTESLKWEDELASHTKKLLIYPSIVGSIVLLVTIFLLIYLVPKMGSFFRMMGQELPPQTVILIGLSNLMSNYWYLLIGLPIAGAIALKITADSNPGVRRRLDAAKLGIPMIGPILRKIILSRFATVFAMMYGSGIPVVDAVRTTEGVVGNAAIREGIERAGELISAGQNVTRAFESVGLFPPLVLRMLRVGQNTGALDTALMNVSYFYSRDVREAVARFQAMIEPALSLVLGMLLLWVMLSVLGPLYDIITQLKI